MIHDHQRVDRMRADLRDKIARVDHLLSEISDETLKSQLALLRHQFTELHDSWVGSQLEKDRTPAEENYWLDRLSPLIQLSVKQLENHEETVRTFGKGVRLLGV